MSQHENGLAEASTSSAHGSVKEALKRTLEGELIALATVPQMRRFVNHSKEGGGGEHSKEGQDHSKGHSKDSDGGDGIISVDDGAYAQFAERLIKLQQNLSS